MHPQYGHGPPYPHQPPRTGMSTGARAALWGCGGCGGLVILAVMAVGCVAVLAPSTDQDRTERPDVAEVDEVEEDAEEETSEEDLVLAFIGEQADAVTVLLDIPEGEVTLADVGEAIAVEQDYADQYTDGNVTEWLAVVDEHAAHETAWAVEDCVWGYEWFLDDPAAAPQDEHSVRDDCAEAVELVDTIT